VIELAGLKEIQVAQTNLLPEDMYGADECFLTGTAAEVVPVTKIDGQVIGTGKPGLITKGLIQSFHEYVNSRG
jgi:branched-chain amino acid aminotransferase